MNKDDTIFILVNAIGVVFIGAAFISASVILATGISNSKWQAEVIRRGYAIHCPLDGKFAWNGECSVQDSSIDALEAQAK